MLAGMACVCLHAHFFGVCAHARVQMLCTWLGVFLTKRELNVRVAGFKALLSIKMLLR